MANQRSKLDTILGPGFDDPFMSHQYIIESVSIHSKVTGAIFAKLFPTRFFQTKTEAVELPFKVFNVTDRHVMATKKFYAEYASFSSFNATFFEDKWCNAMKGFVGWQNLIVNDNAEYSPTSRYQAEMVLHLLDCDDNPVAKVTFTGVFPTQITTVALTGSEITRIALQVAFSVNKVKWDL